MLDFLDTSLLTFYHCEDNHVSSSIFSLLNMMKLFIPDMKHIAK